MTTPLDSLEAKIDAVLALYAQVREENHALQAQLAALEGVNRSLVSTIDTTRERLETLMTRLPEEE